MTHRWGSTVSLDLVTEDKHNIAAPSLPGQIEALVQVLPYKGGLSNENKTHYIRHTLLHSCLQGYYDTYGKWSAVPDLCLINESTIMIVSI